MSQLFVGCDLINHNSITYPVTTNQNSYYIQMLGNVEQYGEQDKENSKEWPVNTNTESVKFIECNE